MKNVKHPSWAKMKKSLFASVIVSLVISSSAMAAFTSGSDGSDQALNVTEDTVLPMPSDGIFHFTTIAIAADVTLTFESNVNNTPVYLLATGDVTIDGNIDVSGQGDINNSIGGAPGPGGFAGGKSGVSGFVIPGDGYGPGGGRAPTGSGGSGGSGSYGTSGQNGSGAGGEVYGSQLLVPLVGGSGGAGSYGRSGGGGGGGAILIASTTSIALSGQIISRGGRGGTSLVDGSGGAIRLVAPDVIGAGRLDISGGARGGQGRARVDMYIKGNTEFDIKCISLTFPRQNCSVSSFMKVFIENAPTLQVTKVGEFDVTGNGEYFELPFESEARQAIVIRSNNFRGDVTVRVSLTPISGATIVEDFLISKASGSVQDNTVYMNFPLNTSTRVNVWTIPTP